MILLLDVGNTSVYMGLSDGKELVETYRMLTESVKTPDEYYVTLKSILDVDLITDIALSSVVPRVTETLRRMCVKYLKKEPLIVGPGIKTGLKIKTDNPREVGSDLICDAAAVADNKKPVLVIDLGTANKFIYIKDRAITGAIISTGIQVSRQALIGNTALLPDVDVTVPAKVLGTNTVTCMQSGLTYGTAAMIDGLIERIQEEVKEEFDIILTGGLSVIIKDLCKTKLVRDQRLVLKGLLSIYLRNQA
ncbi:Type III pantothenate kinase [Alteracholeplasma palmae J233]|uniref:Type III pantothenate kinase n=1 Tax=Alteracholeplasma palmae (strain ATCC 49389 / J233) TaxID=1318466 RepID=U4KPW4_ALTPJ|nr:type III pantothenate kinase [Alteracholeplasma palmae]CCV64340.1 Type III pantothenate kinase [Alteracholeplasma palmae J233]